MVLKALYFTPFRWICNHRVSLPVHSANALNSLLPAEGTGDERTSALSSNLSWPAASVAIIAMVLSVTIFAMILTTASAPFRELVLKLGASLYDMFLKFGASLHDMCLKLGASLAMILSVTIVVMILTTASDPFRELVLKLGASLYDMFLKLGASLYDMFLKLGASLDDMFLKLGSSLYDMFLKLLDVSLKFGGSMTSAVSALWANSTLDNIVQLAVVAVILVMVPPAAQTMMKVLEKWLPTATVDMPKK